MFNLCLVSAFVHLNCFHAMVEKIEGWKTEENLFWRDGAGASTPFSLSSHINRCAFCAEKYLRVISPSLRTQWATEANAKAKPVTAHGAIFLRHTSLKALALETYCFQAGILPRINAPCPQTIKCTGRQNKVLEHKAGHAPDGFSRVFFLARCLSCTTHFRVEPDFRVIGPRCVVYKGELLTGHRTVGEILSCQNLWSVDSVVFFFSHCAFVLKRQNDMMPTTQQGTLQ